MPGIPTPTMNDLPHLQPGDLPYTIVVACASHLVIGKNNSLPWYLPEDLKHFKQRTLGKVLIMGGNTFRSLPSVLSDRYHIVVTRGKLTDHPMVDRAKSFADAHLLAQKAASEWSPTNSQCRPSEIIVIGGAQIYAGWLPLTNCIEMTQIDQIIDGDAFFPQLDVCQWNIFKQPWNNSTQGLRYRFVTWQKLP